jgi:ankyrin repeat protein
MIKLSSKFIDNSILLNVMFEETDLPITADFYYGTNPFSTDISVTIEDLPIADDFYYDTNSFSTDVSVTIEDPMFIFSNEVFFGIQPCQKDYLFELIQTTQLDSAIMSIDTLYYIFSTLVSLNNDNHPFTLELLLDNERIDLKYAIEFASFCGNVQIVKLLLKNSRLNPSCRNNRPIRRACERGHLIVVKLLLSDSRVNPADNHNEAVRSASKFGHIHIVKLLLAHPQVDPTAGNNDAIKRATDGGYLEIVKILWQDPRVRQTTDCNFLIRIATRRSHLQIIEFLQEQCIWSAFKSFSLRLEELVQKSQKNNEMVEKLQMTKKRSAQVQVENLVLKKVKFFDDL